MDICCHCHPIFLFLIRFPTRWEDYLENDDIEGLLKELEKDPKARIYKKEQFKSHYIENLYFDLEILKHIKSNWLQVQNDFKKEEFIKTLQTDKNLKNNKIIIFTESMETGLDLYNSLFKQYDKNYFHC